MIILLIYAVINIILAKIDANKIKNGVHIKHGINALVYLILLIPSLFISYTLPISLLALRRIVFDTSLNLFRGLKYDYISLTTTSIIDRVSYKFQEKYGYFIYYGIFLIIVILFL